ncbi:MAG: hypothetical protein P8J86_11665 [Phycisphaerales bacterium]|nr:hypothetical protein [Phycisphaerales bacterium]
MNQHPIDLLPPQVRQRAQAGQRTGRSIALFGGALLLLVVVITHSKMVLDSAEARLASIQREAQDAIGIEKTLASLQSEIAQSQAYIGLYEEVSSPLPMSSILATVINALPETAALDEIHAQLDSGQAVRSARSRYSSQKDQEVPRQLRIELSGFAASDAEIAEMVGRLRVISPFENVSLDFSRTRPIGGKHAREFRLSLQINLAAVYEQISLPIEEGVAHVDQ